uniref:RNA-directed DNA polymerase n=1 Tax=Strongyloides papillosus TaxID=174720 RepID=A0A0N5B321_STREA
MPFEVTDSIEGFLFNLKEAFSLDGIAREDVKIHMCRQKLSKEAQYRIGYHKYSTFEDMEEKLKLEFGEARSKKAALSALRTFELDVQNLESSLRQYEKLVRASAGTVDEETMEQRLKMQIFQYLRPYENLYNVARDSPDTRFRSLIYDLVSEQQEYLARVAYKRKFLRSTAEKCKLHPSSNHTNIECRVQKKLLTKDKGYRTTEKENNEKSHLENKSNKTFLVKTPKYTEVQYPVIFGIDTNTNVVLDTGAMVNICPDSFFKKLLNCQGAINSVDFQPLSTIKGVGSNVHAQATFTTSLTMVGETKDTQFHVLPDDTIQDVLIGLPTLKQFGIQLHKNGELLKSKYEEEGTDLTPVLEEATIKTYLTCFHIDVKVESILNDLHVTRKDIFAINLSDLRFDRTHIEYDIQLIPNAKPKKIPARFIPPGIRNSVYEELDRMEKSGLIYRATSPWSSPIVVVKEKESLRICIDFKYLNSVTVKQQYSTHRPQDLLMQVNGSQIMSVLDAKKGYFQFRIPPEQQYLVSFTVPGRQYCFRVLPFGLTNEVSFYQTAMESILEEEVRNGFVAIWLDDIVVYSKDHLSHIQHLRITLKKLHQAGIMLNPKKCQFFRSEITFLGHRLGNGKFRLEDARVEAISSIQPPQCFKSLRSFLGCIEAFRSFIPQFAVLSLPLTNILSLKEFPNPLPEDALEAFNSLKFQISQKPTLQAPDFEKAKSSEPFSIFSDASKKGIGGALVQGKHIIYLASRKLSKTEQRYSISEVELLSICYCLEKFKYFVVGLPLTIYTDHRALVYIWNKNETNSPRIERLAARIREVYEFKLMYHPAKLNNLADILSRNPHEPPPQEEEADLPSILSCFQVEEEIFKDISHIVEALKRGGREATKYSAYEYDEKTGTLYKFSKSRKLNYAPRTIRNELLNKLHNVTHACYKKLYKQVHLAGFFWPGLLVDCKEWVDNCQPWELMEIDLLEFREAPYNYKYLFVAVDHFSNFTWIKPLRSKKQGPVTEALRSILTYGIIPISILSDNGLEFCNAEMKRLCKEFHIEHLTSEPHRPKGHGAVERKNRQIKETIEKLELARKKRWPLLINEISHAINSIPDEKDQTPYEKFNTNFKEDPSLKKTSPQHQWKPGMKIMVAHRRPVDSKPWRNTGPFTILDTDPTHLLVSKDNQTQDPLWIHHERAVQLY